MLGAHASLRKLCKSEAFDSALDIKLSCYTERLPIHLAATYLRHRTA